MGLWGWFLSLAIFALFTTSVNSSGKYSQQINDQDANLEDANPFRMNKINLIWQKAQKRLTPSKLKEIRHELQLQDKRELEAKRKSGEGEDDDGQYVASVRSMLLDILHRFDLHDAHHDSNTIENLTVRRGKNKDIKMEGKLEKLWKKAESAGFTADQLGDLHKEFVHHQEKIDEFNIMSNELDNFEENSVQHTKDSSFDWKATREKKGEMKLKHKQLKDNLQYLEMLTQIDAADKFDFQHPKVIELWLMAKKANFSDVELKSLKEELGHFEHRLRKQEVFQKQLASSDEGVKMGGLDEIPEKHRVMADKVKDYDYKVKKIHTELKTRIAKNLGHLEL